jgi:hypothetical protein
VRRRREKSPREFFLSAILLFAVASPAAAVLQDDETSNDNIATAPIQMVVPPNDNVVSTDSGLLTFRLGGGDLDYVGIGDLRAGDIVVMSTTPLGDPPTFEVPDTIIGLFSDSGAMECVGDDAFNNDLDQFPTGFGSLCRYEIPADGDYFVGITGFSANPFDGAHFEENMYSLTVNVTRLPEPGVLLQLASGALGLAALRARRRTAHA